MNNASLVIQADHNLNITVGADQWLLVSTELETPTILIKATAEGLIAHPVFVEARKLPSATLAPAQVARVVLGWAAESEAWRLGLLLVDGDTTKYDTLQMRWCELAAWSGQDSVSLQEPRQAAQVLARLINRPFQLIEPDTETRVPAFSKASDLTSTSAEDDDEAQSPSSSMEPTQAYPTIPLKPLPIELEDWRMVLTADGVLWERRRNWWFANIIRIVVSGVLCIFFLLLGIGTQTSGFADVEPTWLPTIGLVIAGILFANLGLLIWRLARANQVVIDTFKRQIYSRGAIFPFVTWRVPFDDINYLVLSQTPARPQGRRRHEDPMNTAQEVWLHVATGKHFYEIVSIGNVEGRSWVWDQVRQHDHYPIRRRLLLAEYDTDAHHAALHIAERVGVPIYLDLV